MKKNNTLALVFLSILLLQGCTNFKKENAPVATEKSGQIPAPSQAVQLTALQKCLNDANMLVKLDQKYQRNYNELHVLINDAKLYASLSAETSENVKATVAPLFEYEINDRCNNISQLLIDAFKNKVKRTSMLNGNS